MCELFTNDVVPLYYFSKVTWREIEIAIKSFLSP